MTPDPPDTVGPTLAPPRPLVAVDSPSPGQRRVRAMIQVLACSGIPTQLLVAQALAFTGLAPFTDAGALNGTWVFALSLVDTVLLVGLACLFALTDGESPARLFLGARRRSSEALLGLGLVFPLLLIAALIIVSIRWLAPALHNVPDNPLAALMSSPRDAWLFLFVALLAGGVREEVQRAFLITRFERHLGGPAVGLAVTSLAFGAGHALQGYDVAVATGALGLAWGWLYLKRRSAVAPMVSHAGFNTLEILLFVIGGPAAV
jgi:membrane protease YdiL (CAAX protease family)